MLSLLGYMYTPERLYERIKLLTAASERKDMDAPHIFLKCIFRVNISR
jgi:hypothetical protein